MSAPSEEFELYKNDYYRVFILLFSGMTLSYIFEPRHITLKIMILIFVSNIIINPVNKKDIIILFIGFILSLIGHKLYNYFNKRKNSITEQNTLDKIKEKQQQQIDELTEQAFEKK